MKITGQIDVWFKDRGYGFIHEHRDGRIVKRFFHASYIYSGKPVADAYVLFNPSESPKGLAAVDVVINDVLPNAAKSLAGVN